MSMYITTCVQTHPKSIPNRSVCQNTDFKGSRDSVFNDPVFSKCCLGAKFSFPEAAFGLPEAKISFPESKFSFPEPKFSIPETKFSFLEATFSFPEAEFGFPEAKFRFRRQNLAPKHDLENTGRLQGSSAPMRRPGSKLHQR